MNDEADLNARDAELGRRVASALDNSVDALDAHTRARLASIRHEAVTRSYKRRIVGGFALAASIVALAVTPLLLHRTASLRHENDTAYLSVDPEMLADMDMLQALGEGE